MVSRLDTLTDLDKDGLVKVDEAVANNVHEQKLLNKKVKFGAEDGQCPTFVETYVYERQPVELYDYRPPVIKPEPLAVLTKLRVEIIESQVPKPISPPINDLTFSTVSWGDSRPGSAEPSISGASQGTAPIPLPHAHQHPNASLLASNLRAYLTSTPISQHAKNNMDSDENPFRPDGNLSHEVEPIVEVYKHRPFPGSPDRHSSLRSPTPANEQGSDLVDSVIVPKSSCSKNSASSAKKSKSTAAEHNLKLQEDNLCKVSCAGNGKTGSSAKEAEVQQRLVTAGKALSPQVVHVGGKKKKCCGSCSVQ